VTKIQQLAILEKVDSSEAFKTICPITEELLNAAFIVRAVNSHEELLDMVYRVLPYIEDLIDMDPNHHCYKLDSLRKMKAEMLQAISKAEGKS